MGKAAVASCTELTFPGLMIMHSPSFATSTADQSPVLPIGSAGSMVVGMKIATEEEIRDALDLTGAK